MQPVLAARRYSVEEYADLLVASETKLEYWNGDILAMAGNSPAHVSINQRLSGQCYVQLQIPAARCRVFTSDLAVGLPKSNSYFLPDLSLTCEEPRFEKIKSVEAFLNPQLIVEILNPSTRNFDEHEKLVAYSSLKTLRHYVLIDSESVWVRVYSRESSDQLWQLRFSDSRDGVIEIDPPGLKLSLSDLYADLEFPAPEPQVDFS
ncbi:MAG: Uma2 family endonuclease [Bryobacter sp.]|nr:Uma2 family endonuclease [Bryobacter sp.]